LPEKGVRGQFLAAYVRNILLCKPMVKSSKILTSFPFKRLRF
jgi:hypothetical protein